MVEPVRYRQTKEAGTDMFEPKATAPHLDSTATSYIGDTKSPGSWPQKGGRASFCPRQSTGSLLDRPCIRSGLCRAATTTSSPHEQTYGPVLHGRNGATVDDILGSGD